METHELLAALRSAYAALDEEKRTRFSRSLSFQDSLFDRWDRASQLGFGEGTSVYNSTQIFGDVEIGANTFVGAFCILDGGYAPLRIGSFVSISAGTHIYTHDSMLWSLSGGRTEKRAGPVTIGDRAYIGSQSILTCGVTIGEMSVVGANSLVKVSVPPRSFVAGSPAQLMGRIEGEGTDVHVVRI